MKNPDEKKIIPWRQYRHDLADGIYWLGAWELRAFHRVGRRIWRIAVPVGGLFLQLYHRTIGKEAARIGKEIHHFFDNLKGGARELKEAGQQGKKAWFHKFWTGIPRAVRRHRKLGGFVFRLVAPLGALAVLWGTLSYWNSLDFSLTVQCNGVTIQDVDNEEVFSDACMMLGERMGSETTSQTQLTFLPAYTLGVRQADTVLYDESQVCDMLLQTTDGVIEEAAGLYVNGSLIGSVKNRADLSYILTGILDKVKEEEKASSSEFVESIQIVSGLYPTSRVMSSDELLDILNSENSPVTVSYTREESYTEVIDYKTRTVEDDSEYTDYSEVTQKGEEGSRKVVDEVTYVDGKETSRKNVSEIVVEEPVDKIVVVGTKERPDGMTPGEASGLLTWPTPNVRVVSSLYEFRWGTMHNGIDIANGASYGQTIVAADGGTVEYVKLHDYGYGYHLCINHGNGMETLYAHCSQILVSPGEQVYKGQPIALIGATGDVTGPHLHFEVLVNGSHVDPLSYVSP